MNIYTIKVFTFNLKFRNFGFKYKQRVQSMIEKFEIQEKKGYKACRRINGIIDDGRKIDLNG